MTQEARNELLTALMRKHGDSLLRLCTIYLRDYAAAQDALQDTFVKAYGHLEDLRDERAERAWLSAIAVNTCKDHMRRAWNRLVDKRDTLEDIPQLHYSQKQADDTVISAVQRLPEKYMQAVLLRYYQGLSLKEIAKAVGAPVPTVTSRLNRAKDKLRKELKGWYFDDED